jgi:hypothetical protein
MTYVISTSQLKGGGLHAEVEGIELLVDADN